MKLRQEIENLYASKYPDTDEKQAETSEDQPLLPNSKNKNKYKSNNDDSDHKKSKKNKNNRNEYPRDYDKNDKIGCVVCGWKLW